MVRISPWLAPFVRAAKHVHLALALGQLIAGTLTFSLPLLHRRDDLGPTLDRESLLSRVKRD